MIEPHFLTRYLSPDTIAETTEGLTPETYRELWASLDALPRTVSRDEIEDGLWTPSEVGQVESTDQVWHVLSDAAKLNINEALSAEEI